MVYVDIEKCTGCGTCAEACPVAAISLVGGTAKVDQEKCTDCEACVEVCPNGAMLAVREPLAERAVVPIVRPAAKVIQVRPQPALVSLWVRAAPAVGATLTFLGRNVAPRLADYLLNALDRRLSQGQASPAAEASGGVSPASGVRGRDPSTGSGRGHRRRRRRGQG
ncbi:MAG: 4Fe-4S binding protein [Anaerolineales bacterium]|nr:4Fe-4S binding protein [Anaerolineales bacterium]